MRINCGPTWYERQILKQKWHRWFAWRPVRVASNDCRWLEWIERKGTIYHPPPGVWCSSFWEWEYRAL